MESVFIMGRSFISLSVSFKDSINVDTSGIDSNFLCECDDVLVDELTMSFTFIEDVEAVRVADERPEELTIFDLMPLKLMLGVKRSIEENEDELWCAFADGSNINKDSVSPANI